MVWHHPRWRFLNALMWCVKKWNLNFRWIKFESRIFWFNLIYSIEVSLWKESPHGYMWPLCCSPPVTPQVYYRIYRRRRSSPGRSRFHQTEGELRPSPVERLAWKKKRQTSGSHSWLKDACDATDTWPGCATPRGHKRWMMNRIKTD